MKKKIIEVVVEEHENDDGMDVEVVNINDEPKLNEVTLDIMKTILVAIYNGYGGDENIESVEVKSHDRDGNEREYSITRDSEGNQE